MKRVLLIGAGNAHLVLLRALAKAPVYGARFMLVSQHAKAVYSGMLPGVIAGHYRLEEAQIDLPALAERAFAEFVEGSVVALDADPRLVRLDDGAELAYDMLSINAGALVDASVPGAQHALPAKPLQDFIRALEQSKLHRVAIVGAGAAGAELAMALRHRGAAVTLYADRPMFGAELEVRLERALRGRKVDFRPGMPVASIEPGPVVIAGRTRQEFDHVILTTGAAPLPWLGRSGLAVDEKGFALVGETLQSVSHPEVFASGDCATVQGRPHPRSGVYSMRQGTVLAENVAAVFGKRALSSYRPQSRALTLISCGSRYAIAHRGGWTAEGRWVWRWKDWIDRRWIRSFAAT